MQPDNQNNYWQQDPNEPGQTEKYEMYTPTPMTEAEAPVVSGSDNVSTPSDNEPIRWSASEYIPEEKNTVWFITCAIICAILIATDILFLKSYTFSVLVVVMAAALVVYSRRSPRIIDYVLSGDQGLYVGERLYHFNEFKAFGLIRDRDQYSIMLIPVKRFSPGVSVYFPAEMGEKIVDILGARLPMENRKLDFIDIVVRKLHL
jgi:hypothetical protein